MAALFSPKTPEVKPAAPLPDEYSPGVLEARKRAALGIGTREGRRSTILSEDEGGGTFNSGKLGG
jgi:hypothetical protein